jgi:NADH-quinone oxidoreductase subunit N
MISLGYYLPVLAAMWMREAPAGEPRPGPEPPAPSPTTGTLPALAGGSRELDAGAAGESGAGSNGPLAAAQPEVALVAVLGGAATLFFGVVPQPLFDLVHQVGGAFGLL